MEEMLGVFQNTLLKRFGEEACFFRGTQTTLSHFWRGGERGRTAVWNNPRLFFAAFYAL